MRDSTSEDYDTFPWDPLWEYVLGDDDEEESRDETERVREDDSLSSVLHHYTYLLPSNGSPDDMNPSKKQQVQPNRQRKDQEDADVGSKASLDDSRNDFSVSTETQDKEQDVKHKHRKFFGRRGRSLSDSQVGSHQPPNSTEIYVKENVVEVNFVPQTLSSSDIEQLPERNRPKNMWAIRRKKIRRGTRSESTLNHHIAQGSNELEEASKSSEVIESMRRATGVPARGSKNLQCDQSEGAEEKSVRTRKSLWSRTKRKLESRLGGIHPVSVVGSSEKQMTRVGNELNDEAYTNTTHTTRILVGTNAPSRQSIVFADKKKGTDSKPDSSPSQTPTAVQSPIKEETEEQELHTLASKFSLSSIPLIFGSPFIEDLSRNQENVRKDYAYEKESVLSGVSGEEEVVSLKISPENAKPVTGEAEQNRPRGRRSNSQKNVLNKQKESEREQNTLTECAADIPAQPTLGIDLHQRRVLVPDEKTAQGVFSLNPLLPRSKAPIEGERRRCLDIDERSQSSQLSREYDSESSFDLDESLQRPASADDRPGTKIKNKKKRGHFLGPLFCHQKETDGAGSLTRQGLESEEQSQMWTLFSRDLSRSGHVSDTAKIEDVGEGMQNRAQTPRQTKTELTAVRGDDTCSKSHPGSDSSKKDQSIFQSQPKPKLCWSRDRRDPVEEVEQGEQHREPQVGSNSAKSLSALGGRSTKGSKTSHDLEDVSRSSPLSIGMLLSPSVLMRESFWSRDLEEPTPRTREEDQEDEPKTTVRTFAINPMSLVFATSVDEDSRSSGDLDKISRSSQGSNGRTQKSQEDSMASTNDADKSVKGKVERDSHPSRRQYFCYGRGGKNNTSASKEDRAAINGRRGVSKPFPWYQDPPKLSLDDSVDRKGLESRPARARPSLFCVTGKRPARVESVASSQMSAISYSECPSDSVDSEDDKSKEHRSLRVLKRKLFRSREQTAEQEQKEETEGAFTC